ncbi:MAG TPA: hypothetical protein VKK79_21060, partial [Candidatus Lokiarchaeia archaeon]|nr:hypothetical protein [Candidatus Lokiarchaeia archaeon]
LGILFPLMGIFGFFIGDTSALTTLFPTVDVLSNPLMHFYLFEAGGAQYLVDYYSLASIGGPAWVLMLVFGFALLASAILAILFLMYSSYMTSQGFHAEKFYERIFPVTTVLFIIFEWILMAITLAGTAPHVTLLVDPIGLTCSIIAIALLLLAIFRDRVIRV